MKNLVDRTAAAHRLGISPRTLEKWAVSGEGPVFYKLGGRVVYDIGDLQAWVATRRRRSTSDLAGEGSHHA